MVNKNISKGLLLAMLFVPAMSIRADDPPAKTFSLSAFYNSTKTEYVGPVWKHSQDLGKALIVFDLVNGWAGKWGCKVDTSVVSDVLAKATGYVPGGTKTLGYYTQFLKVAGMWSIAADVGSHLTIAEGTAKISQLAKDVKTATSGLSLVNITHNN